MRQLTKEFRKWPWSSPVCMPMPVEKQPTETDAWQAADALLLLDCWAMLALKWREP